MFLFHTVKTLFWRSSFSFKRLFQSLQTFSRFFNCCCHICSTFSQIIKTIKFPRISFSFEYSIISEFLPILILKPCYSYNLIRHYFNLEEFLPVISPATGSFVSTSVLRAHMQFIMVRESLLSRECSAGDWWTSFTNLSIVSMLDLRFFPDISDVVNVALYVKEFVCICLHCFVFRLLSQNISKLSSTKSYTIYHDNFHSLNYVFWNWLSENNKVKFDTME